MMADGLKIYLVCWLSAVTLSLLIIFRNRKTGSYFQRPYWRFLLEPWKIISFAGAMLLLVLAAPYSGDPTWDVPNAIMISILTYVLAPWSVAVLFRRIKSKQFDRHTFVALCLFFIPCWAYDGYILLRDGLYPATWYSNLYVSGAIVFVAGLFWNLFWYESEGLTLAFLRREWPPAEKTPFTKVVWPCLVLGGLVAAGIGWFVYMYFKDVRLQ